MDKNFSFDYLVHLYELDVPNTFKDKYVTRDKLKKLYGPLLADTRFYFEDNNRDGNKAILEIHEEGVKGRRIHFHTLCNMKLTVAFKLDIYDLLKDSAKLPPNERGDKYKTQPHVTMELAHMWNTLCILTGKESAIKK